MWPSHVAARRLWARCAAALGWAEVTPWPSDSFAWQDKVLEDLSYDRPLSDMELEPFGDTQRVQTMNLRARPATEI